jgi:hypothetical protein
MQLSRLENKMEEAHDKKQTVDERISTADKNLDPSI